MWGPRDGISALVTPESLLLPPRTEKRLCRKLGRRLPLENQEENPQWKPTVLGTLFSDFQALHW